MTNSMWNNALLGALDKFFFRHCMDNTWETIRFGDEEVKEHWTEAYIYFLESTKDDKEKMSALLEWYYEKQWEKENL
jgi:hypothetical protein